MKKSKFSQIFLICVHLGILIFLGCAQRPPLKDLGDGLSYVSKIWPINIKEDPNNNYFLILNTNALREYKKGSVILFQENTKSQGEPKKVKVFNDFPFDLFPISVAQNDKNLVAIGFAGQDPMIRFYNFKDPKKPKFLKVLNYKSTDECETEDCEFWGDKGTSSIEQMGFFKREDKRREFFYYTVNAQSHISRIRILELKKDTDEVINFSEDEIKIPEDLEKTPEDFKKQKERYVLSYTSPSLMGDDNKYFVFLPQGISGDDRPDLPSQAYDYMQDQKSEKNIKYDEGIRRASLGIVSLEKLLDGKSTISESKEALNASTKFVPLAWDKNGRDFSKNAEEDFDKDSFSFKKKFWMSYAISDFLENDKTCYEEKGQKDLLVVQKDKGSSANDILRISGINDFKFDDYKTNIVSYKDSNLKISLYSKAIDNKTLDGIPNAILDMSMLKVNDAATCYRPLWVRRSSIYSQETFGLGKSWLGLNSFDGSQKLNTEPILHEFIEKGGESCTVFGETIYCFNFGNSHLSTCSFKNDSFSCQIHEIK